MDRLRSIDHELKSLGEASLPCYGLTLGRRGDDRALQVSTEVDTVGTADADVTPHHPSQLGVMKMPLHVRCAKSERWRATLLTTCGVLDLPVGRSTLPEALRPAGVRAVQAGQPLLRRGEHCTVRSHSNAAKRQPCNDASLRAPVRKSKAVRFVRPTRRSCCFAPSRR